MGRKSRYETHVQPRLDQIKEWYQLNTEDQIAKRLGISTASFQKYKREHAELREALREGREALVENLKMSLKKKAELSHAVRLEESGITNPSRYRSRNLPTAGAILKEEDSTEKQIAFDV